MPQLRNTDQGECVITRASDKQNVNKASAPSNRVKSPLTRLSQSRLETLATSMPQLRNKDQGECVITRASYKQNVNKASAPSNRVKSTPTRLSQSRLETLATSMPQLRNTDQGECVITRASYKQDNNKASAASNRVKLAPTRLSQSRLETLATSMPQLRNTDQGECVITRASDKQDNNKASAASNRVKSTPTRLSQSRLETLATSMPQLRNTDQGECVITRASDKQKVNKASAPSNRVKSPLTRLSQSRLETLTTSMPQLRNTDQGECVITRASYKQNVNKASAASNRVKSTPTRLSQSRLETLATSMPQLRNTDQGECVITRASDKQNVNKASAPSNRVKSTPTRLSQSRLETLATSMPQLRNTDQGECVITRASDKQKVNKASAASNRVKSTPTRLSQSRLETLATSMPQLRNTDQGECVITRASYKQNLNKASTPSNRVKSAPTGLSQYQPCSFIAPQANLFKSGAQDVISLFGWLIRIGPWTPSMGPCSSGPYILLIHPMHPYKMNQGPKP